MIRSLASDRAVANTNGVDSILVGRARHAASCRRRLDRPVAAAGLAGDKGATCEKDMAEAMLTLEELVRTIDQRAGASAETSYTRSLLDKGAAHCARKFGEEAIELAIAAAALDEGAVRAEAADVLYHLLVVLRARGVTLSSVMNELDTRSVRSGHQEKASRTS
jgi:phosphoribosyl-ATP pyrophosphohydrolase